MKLSIKEIFFSILALIIFILSAFTPILPDWLIFCAIVASLPVIIFFLVENSRDFKELDEQINSKK